jgi:hypothetical protein
MNATEDILPYYAEGGLSAIFHDLLAEREPGRKRDAAFYLSLLHVNPGRVLGTWLRRWSPELRIEQIRTQGCGYRHR